MSISRLQELCPECNKPFKEKFHINTIDPKTGNEIKMITGECFHIITRVTPKATPFETMVSHDWKDSIKNCKHIWDKNKCTVCNEFKLYPFQVVGARFAEIGLAIQKGIGIMDDMGLGKTVQALAVIKFHPDLYTPTLYVVKSAIKFNWWKETIRWLGPDFMGQVISTSKDFILPNLKSYIISYDLLKRYLSERLEKMGIKCVILDECQQIKNADSSRTQAIRNFLRNPAIKVIPLSGTPWKNHGDEFFPVLNMLSPTKFYSQQRFLDQWVAYYWEGNKRKMGGINRPDEFREYVKELIIRREFDEVMDEFPSVNRMKLPVQLDELSQSSYDEEVSAFVKWYNAAIIDGTEETLSGIELLAKMARMRHICGLAKIPATLGYVEEFIEDTNKKLVIFVHHKDVGEILFNEISKLYGKDIDVVKLTAEFSDEERFNIQEAFNKSKRSIMIASTLASGEGVNLQSCSDCILHERQWNPQNEEQAAPGRFKRIGQISKVINITVPEGEGTIDEHLDGIIERKRKYFHEVMNKSESVTWNEGDMGKELAALIIKKHKEKNKGKDLPKLRKEMVSL